MKEDFSNTERLVGREDDDTPNTEKGLCGKYIIHKAKDGSPVTVPCFVLKATDPHAIPALSAYIESCIGTHPELACDLILMKAEMEAHRWKVKALEAINGEKERGEPPTDTGPSRLFLAEVTRLRGLLKYADDKFNLRQAADNLRDDIDAGGSGDKR